jgi:hypothetical protein
MKRTLENNLTIKIAMLTGLMAGIAGMPPTLRAVEASGPAAVSKMLSDAKTQSYRISIDAETLDTYVRQQPDLSWQSHATELNQMREDINAMGKTVSKLLSAKAEAAPWQAVAIDRIVPYLKEIAEDTTAAIEYLDKHQPQPKITGDYKGYIEANADESSHLARLVADYVDYGNSNERSHNLRRTLELPAK